MIIKITLTKVKTVSGNHFQGAWGKNWSLMEKLISDPGCNRAGLFASLLFIIKKNSSSGERNRKYTSETKATEKVSCCALFLQFIDTPWYMFVPQENIIILMFPLTFWMQKGTILMVFTPALLNIAIIIMICAIRLFNVTTFVFLSLKGRLHYTFCFTGKCGTQETNSCEGFALMLSKTWICITWRRVTNSRMTCHRIVKM